MLVPARWLAHRMTDNIADEQHPVACSHGFDRPTMDHFCDELLERERDEHSQDTVEAIRLNQEGKPMCGAPATYGGRWAASRRGGHRDLQCWNQCNRPVKVEGERCWQHADKRMADTLADTGGGDG